MAGGPGLAVPVALGVAGTAELHLGQLLAEA